MDVRERSGQWLVDSKRQRQNNLSREAREREKRDKREKRNKGEDVNHMNEYQLVKVGHQQLRPKKDIEGRDGCPLDFINHNHCPVELLGTHTLASRSDNRNDPVEISRGRAAPPRRTTTPSACRRPPLHEGELSVSGMGRSGAARSASIAGNVLGRACYSPISGGFL